MDFEPSAEQQMLIDQVRRLPEVIPVTELAVQWDIASAVFQYLETGKPTGDAAEDDPDLQFAYGGPFISDFT